MQIILISPIQIFYMRNILWFLFTCILLPGHAQDLQKQTQQLTSPYSNEVFSVLKSDNIIKSGNYEKYFQSGTLAEKGQYEANRKTGVWDYYNSKGELEQQYNWTSGKLEFGKPFSNIENFWVEENGVYVEKKPDELPNFLGGNYAFQRHLVAMIRYPAQALRNKKQGKVYISAVITADGKMVDEKAESSLGYGLEEEALRVFKAIEGEWIPGKVNGKPVNTKILMPCRFGMQ